MITIDGYSKDPSLQAEGIVITWSKDLIVEKGGLLCFIRYFEKTMHQEDSRWLQKCNNQPTRDINYVYINLCGQIRYRLYYGGYETGPTNIYFGNGHSWSSSMVIDWSRIVMGGPFVKAPQKIYRPGFQGFRYATKLF